MVDRLVKESFKESEIQDLSVLLPYGVSTVDDFSEESSQYSSDAYLAQNSYHSIQSNLNLNLSTTPKSATTSTTKIVKGAGKGSKEKEKVTARSLSPLSLKTSFNTDRTYGTDKSNLRRSTGSDNGASGVDKKDTERGSRQEVVFEVEKEPFVRISRMGNKVRHSITTTATVTIWIHAHTHMQTSIFHLILFSFHFISLSFLFLF